MLASRACSGDPPTTGTTTDAPATTDVPATTGSSTTTGGVPYGEGVSWNEPTLDGQQVSQALDIHVPKDMSDMPAVLWAHANGSSKSFAANSGLANNALGPAIAAGQVVVSVEFR